MVFPRYKVHQVIWHYVKLNRAFLLHLFASIFNHNQGFFENWGPGLV